MFVPNVERGFPFIFSVCFMLGGQIKKVNSYCKHLMVLLFIFQAAWETSNSTSEEQQSGPSPVSIKPSREPDEVTQPDGHPDQWPQSGAVVFDQYKARYRDGLDLTLKGVTCTIQSGEKVKRLSIVRLTGSEREGTYIHHLQMKEMISGGSLSMY